MKIDRKDLYYKRFGDEILLLNRETGRWYVGEDKNKTIDSLMNKSGCSYENDELVKNLMEQNILNTDISDIKIEMPYSDGLNLLILDTTNKCNLACKYCFASATMEGQLMNLETAMNALNMALNYTKCSDVLTVEFSGGEPLINFELIREFIPKAIETAKKKNKRMSFTIQTNGTLLNDEIIDFLIEYDVNIGFSVDGTEKYHDTNRIFSDGQGTLATIKKNIKKIQSKGGHVSILAVISSAEQYDSVIQFAIENNVVNIRTNLVTKVGRAQTEDDFILDYDKVADKFIEVALKIFNEDLRINDATLTFYLWNLLLWQPHMCFRSPCGAAKNQVSISVTGDIYPCQGWRNIKDNAIGNVNDNCSLDDIFAKNTRVSELQKRDVRILEACKDCDWKMFCGICPREVYTYNARMDGKIPECVFQSKVFEALTLEFSKNRNKIKKYLLRDNK